MKLYKIKKLFENKADTRDYVVANCIKKRNDLKFVLVDSRDIPLETMTIDYRELGIKGEKENILRAGKWGKNYKLVRFDWKKDLEMNLKLFNV